MKTTKKEDLTTDDFFYQWMDLVLKHFHTKECDCFVTTSQIIKTVVDKEQVNPLDTRRTGMILRELFGESIQTSINGKKQQVYHVKII